MLCFKELQGWHHVTGSLSLFLSLSRSLSVSLSVSLVCAQMRSQVPAHVALHCIFLFEVIPIIFQAIKNHHGKPCASEVPLQEIIQYLSALIYRPNFIIGSITITEKLTFIGRYRYGGRYIVHPYHYNYFIYYCIFSFFLLPDICIYKWSTFFVMKLQKIFFIYHYLYHCLSLFFI